jgi:hypothetical protein
MEATAKLSPPQLSPNAKGQENSDSASESTLCIPDGAGHIRESLGAQLSPSVDAVCKRGWTPLMSAP